MSKPGQCWLKVPGGLVPMTPEAEAVLARAKLGEVLRSDFTMMRNGKFFRKWWVLVKYAFDQWDPPELENKWGKVEKSFERFRKDVIILAGFYEQNYRLNGETRLEASSLAWSRMTEAEFTELYDKTADKLIEFVLKNCDRADVDRIVDTIIRTAE